MSAVGAVIKEIVDIGVGVITNPSVQKVVLGKYDDGTTRSIPDALSGETRSPKKRNKKKKKSTDVLKKFDIM